MHNMKFNEKGSEIPSLIEVNMDISDTIFHIVGCFRGETLRYLKKTTQVHTIRYKISGNVIFTNK